MAVASAWKELIPDSCFLAIQRQIAKYVTHSFAKASNLDKPGLDGIAQSDCNQHNEQNVIGKVAVDCLYNG